MSNPATDPEETLAGRSAPSADTTGDRPARRIFVRRPWEMAASILIGLGVFMMMQPFWMAAFTYSFIVTLTGTVMFLIVSHFPE
ncbi:hypothetical protein [Pseudoruegeria sp. HB172150]|uniref:hypothetical protein n=1 Tax=Pseudoruegeria sp. HB172150 TaxID=2721164 RepID=UPI001556D81F|nr:hypothetical protein [Pseudoruegeria sp. HB172150]